MAWGSGPYGITPWGGGEPSALGDVRIISVQFITPTFIRLNLNTQVVVNASYANVANYTVAAHTNTPVPPVEVNVVEVMVPAQDVLVADYVYLKTTTHTNGAYYNVSFFQLSTLDGVSGFGQAAAPYVSRVTKSMNVLKSLPSHYDRRVEALLHSLVAAISLQDDAIGGSRSDDFP